MVRYFELDPSVNVTLHGENGGPVTPHYLVVHCNTRDFSQDASEIRFNKPSVEIGSTHASDDLPRGIDDPNMEWRTSGTQSVICPSDSAATTEVPKVVTIESNGWHLANPLSLKYLTMYEREPDSVSGLECHLQNEGSLWEKWTNQSPGREDLPTEDQPEATPTE